MSEELETVSREEANRLRCLAHEIIIKLMNAKHQAALNLLRKHCEAALEKLEDCE